MSNRIYKDHPEKLNFYQVNKFKVEDVATKYTYCECDTQCGPLLARWSVAKNGCQSPPAVGERINATVNGFGPGEVVGYFVEGGWMGVEVKLDVRPDWHIKINGDKHPHPLVFGNEIERL